MPEVSSSKESNSNWVYWGDVRHAHTNKDQQTLPSELGDFLTLEKEKSTKTGSPALEKLSYVALLGSFDSATSGKQLLEAHKPSPEQKPQRSPVCSSRGFLQGNTWLVPSASPSSKLSWIPSEANLARLLPHHLLECSSYLTDFSLFPRVCAFPDVNCCPLWQLQCCTGGVRHPRFAAQPPSSSHLSTAQGQ